MNINNCSDDYIQFRKTDIEIVLQAIKGLLKSFDFGFEISKDFDWYFIDGKSGGKFKVPLDTVRQILNEVEDER